MLGCVGGGVGLRTKVGHTGLVSKGVLDKGHTGHCPQPQVLAKHETYNMRPSCGTTVFYIFYNSASIMCLALVK